MPRKHSTKALAETPRDGSVGRLELPDLITEDLGIHFTVQDVQYLFFSMLDFGSDPESVRRKAALYAKLLERVLPDTELTRHRTARLLEGLEALSRAIRVLLTLPEVDLVGGARDITIAWLNSVATRAQGQDQRSVEPTAQNLAKRITGLANEVSQAKDPRMRAALEILSRADALLDVKHPMPKIPRIDELELKLFEPAHAVKPGHRR